MSFPRSFVVGFLSFAVLACAVGTIINAVAFPFGLAALLALRFAVPH